MNAHILEEPDSIRLHYRAALSHEYVLTGNRHEKSILHWSHFLVAFYEIDTSIRLQSLRRLLRQSRLIMRRPRFELLQDYLLGYISVDI